jgi:aryl sulfotransferase
MLSKPEPARKRYDGKISDPSRWYSISPRAGDIVVSSPPKSGNTWTQAILALLISGDPDVDADVSNKAPWVDITFDGQDRILQNWQVLPGQRRLKTHTPLDGIPFWPGLEYILIFRHPIDVYFSFRKHVHHMKEKVLSDIFPDDISAGFRIFLEGDHHDGASLNSIIDHYRSALAFGSRQNLLCLHYADMGRDPAKTFDRIAGHIGVTHPPDVMAKLVEAASFGNMKSNANRFAVAAGEGFWRDDADFFDSGTSNKWLGVLTDADIAAYDARMSGLLGVEERAWLEWGASRV